MSHRVHPKAFRIKGMQDWHSRGFYEKKLAKYLEEDFKIRTFLTKKLKLAEIEKIDIERYHSSFNIIIYSARPGLIIGRRGQNINKLKNDLQEIIGKKDNFKIEIKTIKNPWLSAVLVAKWIAQQTEKRVAYRKVLKQALSKLMINKEIKGARVQVAGRLNGVEMSRTEWLKKGRLPRQTIRSNIDYGQAQAFCAYGVIGVKVWIYKGEEKNDENIKSVD